MIAFLMRALGVNKALATVVTIGITIGAAAALVAGASWWHGGQVESVRKAAYAAGVADERTTWQDARTELMRRRTESTRARDNELAGVRADIRAETEKQNDLLAAFLAKRTPADRAALCFDDDLVRATETARAAVRSSAAAGRSGAPVSILPGSAAAGDKGSDGELDHQE